MYQLSTAEYYTVEVSVEVHGYHETHVLKKQCLKSFPICFAN